MQDIFEITLIALFMFIGFIGLIYSIRGRKND